ncbi:sensor histidine kinase [Subsaximicrobium wynnwilliamsii]|uniref:sensor histidine kinase n=1 Tax=Subsaximicrobium wynnwilliamsii TaxID=291179 RepID=UPI001CB9BCC0|nr:sensor histidine kinase [Subsaximicrobium wynnwilliamsii]
MSLFRKIVPVACFYFAFLNALIAQNPSQIDVFTTEQGLPYRDIKSITQDKNEFIWMGTALGLLRYDGYNIKTYNSNKSNSLFIEEEYIMAGLDFDDATNDLWYIANGELFTLNPLTDKSIAYDKTHNIMGSVLFLLKNKDGSFWIISDDFKTAKKGKAKQYLQKFNGDRFEIKHAILRGKVDYIRLISDYRGHILWSTPNGSLKFDPDGNLEANFDLSSFKWLGTDLKFNVSFYDSCNNHYFFPQQERGIYIFDEDNLTHKRILDKPIQFYNAIEDYQKHVWFAGLDELYRMSPEGEFTDYTAQLKARFEYSIIRDLFIDANKLLWVATDNGSFKIRIGDELFKPLFKSNTEGWGNTMRGIFEDKNGTIFAKCENSNTLLYKTLNGEVDTLQIQLDKVDLEAMQHTANFFVVDNKKEHVFTLGETLMKINLKDGSVKSYDEFRNYVTFKGQNPLIKLRDGKLLFGQSLSQLVLFDIENETSTLLFKDSEIEDDISNFMYFEESKTDSLIWIGTQNDGLLKVHLNGRLEKQFTIKTTPNISRNCIRALEEDTDGSLWVGTYGGGLNHISADGNTVKTFTKSQQLPNNNVVGLLSDHANGLWISTYNGLSHFDKTTEIFQNYYTEDGLTHFEFNYASFFKDSRGNFYFGGMNGLNRFEPKEIVRESNPPKLSLLSASGYNNQNKSSFIADYNKTKFSALELSPYDQYFEIKWTMTSYFQNQKNTFSTKLEGLEDRWFYQGNSASIRYNQLPAGNYTLKIKGKDSRGIDSASVLSIPITVRQIFYKEWWFILLVLLTVIGLMYAVFRYRLQQVLAMERLRTKISSDLHDDVGSLLSGLAMQTELMEINANQADKFKLQKIAEISRNAVSRLRDLVWSIDSRRETVGDLIERMQELAEEVLLPAQISFQIDSTSVKNPSRKLLAQTKQHLFLIYKEAITNILRHSNATEVHIKFVNYTNSCDLVILDNGCKKETYKSTGLGLDNMRMRAESIKGCVDFKQDDGFSVVLHLPFSM